MAENQEKIPPFIVILLINKDMYIVINWATYTYKIWSRKPSLCWAKPCHILRVSCQKGPTHHAYAWQIGPFWQDTLDLCLISGSDHAQHNPRITWLTHWAPDKMDAISQTTFSSAFSWLKMFEFWFKFPWSLFLRVQQGVQPWALTKFPDFSLTILWFSLTMRHIIGISLLP